jgi:hypothetical protein
MLTDGINSGVCTVRPQTSYVEDKELGSTSASVQHFNAHG